MTLQPIDRLALLAEDFFTWLFGPLEDACEVVREWRRERVVVRILHAAGLTNLTDDQVNKYVAWDRSQRKMWVHPY